MVTISPPTLSEQPAQGRKLRPSRLSAQERQQTLAAIELEQRLRNLRRSFLEFLPHWQFVNRETGQEGSFSSLWQGQTQLAQIMTQERWVLALKAGKLGFTELACAYDGWASLFGPRNSRVHVFSRDDNAA